MGNSKRVINGIRTALDEQDRNYAWLSRAANTPYKRLLAEVKYETRPLGLDTAINATSALNLSLVDFIDEPALAAEGRRSV